MPGPTELVIILVVIVVLFGARKLPELSRAVGESIQEFRKASDQAKTDESASSGDDEA